MLTAHLLTKNNRETVVNAIESVKSSVDLVLVGDLGSTDETVDICKSMGAQVKILGDRPRNEARNLLSSYAQEINFFIEPWEVLVRGHDLLKRIHDTSYVKVLQEKFLSKEIRLWKAGNHFVNPVYERIDCPTDIEYDVVISSEGRQDHREILEWFQYWKETEPLSPTPYYYEACTLLMLGEYDKFLTMSEHFMFLSKTESMALTMNRYYYALVQMMYKKSAKPAMQNINLCLCEKPLMAEFWCLMGDVSYHLLHRFVDAKNFYENAMILGSRRLENDKWPMDLSKYRSYPTRMIKSCEVITSQSTTFGNYSK